MQALFIGQAYIDITFLVDRIPQGDEKTVARDFAVAFGGNAVTAAFACARLGIVPDLLATLGDDWLGRMFMDMASSYRMPLHVRKVERSSLSFIMPNNGKRAIVRCRDDNYLHPFPQLNLNGCRTLHIDGHQGDAAIAYARLARERGILVSLDGGGVRDNTMELLSFVDVAMVSERFCEQLGRSAEDTIGLLADKGCRVAGVTLGEHGLVWQEHGQGLSRLPALAVPADKIVDTNMLGTKREHTTHQNRELWLHVPGLLGHHARNAIHLDRWISGGLLESKVRANVHQWHRDTEPEHQEGNQSTKRHRTR